MSVEMKTLTCPGPPEHEFEIPKGRGRPPRYCEDHKPNGKQEGSKVETEEKKTRKAPPTSSKSKSNGSGETKSGTRKAPRIKPGPDRGWADDPNPAEAKAKEDAEEQPRDEGLRRLPPPGKRDTGSRAKAERAADQAESQQPEQDWPRGQNRRPMARIEFSASELIPTGQYANVSVGPARITAFVDLDREVAADESYFSEEEAQNLIKATNELAEMVERDVIAIQRNLVLESLQDDDNGDS